MTKKTYDAEFKAKLALEALKGEKTAAQLCRQHTIAQDLLSRWRAQLIERAPELFKTPRQQSAEERRIAELERLVGQLTLELRLRLKSLQSASLTLAQRRGLVTALRTEVDVQLLCNVIGLAPSSYYYQPAPPMIRSYGARSRPLQPNIRNTATGASPPSCGGATGS